MSMLERINERLEAVGLSKAAASKKAGCNTHLLQNLFASDKPSMRTENLLALAKVLECNPGWLLTGEGAAPGEEKIVKIVRRIRDKDALRSYLQIGETLADSEETDTVSK